MIYFLRIFVIFCFLLIFKLHAEAAQPVLSSGETVLLGKFDQFKVQVKIKTHEVDIGKPSDSWPDKRESSCTHSRYPCSLVDLIEISINGNAIFVPRSSFCDRADLNSVELQLIDHKFILILSGGDASESYLSKIIFDQERIIGRKLWSKLMPDEIIQETIYYKQVEQLD